VFTRRGNDWTNRFRKIASDAWPINAGSAIIDGEVVVLAEDGTTDFSVLQNELKGRSKTIVMVAFDLLYPNGYDLRDPEDAALQQEDRASGDMGRARVACGDRIPGEVGRGESAPSFLQVFKGIWEDL
jgi:hypothetical protein